MPRRILLLITDLEIGGTPTVVRELAARLHAPPEVEVEVACLAKRGPVADQIRAAGVAVTALDARGPFDLLRTIKRLRALVHERRIDTVLSFLVHANVVATLASRKRLGVRSFQSIQTTQPEPRWHWKLQRLVHHAAEKVIVPSDSVAQVARTRSAVPAAKIVVIPNGVDVAAFAAVAERRLRLPRNPFQVGFIGRLDPVKRVPDLLQAFAGFSPDKVHVHVFGDGAERPRIEAEVRRLRMESLVTLHGSIARPQEALERLDVLVLPSEAEGFGLVLIEAMASGVPVVATDVPGIRDVAKNADTAVLVPPRTPAAICGAATMLCLNHELRHAMVERARAEVIRRFGWPAVIAQYRATLGLRGAD